MKAGHILNFGQFIDQVWGQPGPECRVRNMEGRYLMDVRSRITR